MLVPRPRPTGAAERAPDISPPRTGHSGQRTGRPDRPLRTLQLYAANGTWSVRHRRPWVSSRSFARAQPEISLLWVPKPDGHGALGRVIADTSALQFDRPHELLVSGTAEFEEECLACAREASLQTASSSAVPLPARGAEPAARACARRARARAERCEGAVPVRARTPCRAARGRRRCDVRLPDGCPPRRGPRGRPRGLASVGAGTTAHGRLHRPGGTDPATAPRAPRWLLNGPAARGLGVLRPLVQLRRNGPPRSPHAPGPRVARFQRGRGDARGMAALASASPASARCHAEALLNGWIASCGSALGLSAGRARAPMLASDATCAAGERADRHLSGDGVRWRGCIDAFT